MAKFTSQEVTALKEGGNQVNTLNLSSFDEFFSLGICDLVSFVFVTAC